MKAIALLLALLTVNASPSASFSRSFYSYSYSPDGEPPAPDPLAGYWWLFDPDDEPIGTVHVTHLGGDSFFVLWAYAPTRTSDGLKIKGQFHGRGTRFKACLAVVWKAGADAEPSVTAYEIQPGGRVEGATEFWLKARVPMTVGVARYAEAYCDIRRQTPARTIDHEAAQAVGEAFVVLGSRVLEQWARDFDRFPNLPDEKTCKLYYDLACGNLAALRHRGLASGSFSDRDEWFPGGPQAGWMAEQFQAAQGRYAIWRLAFLIRDPWAKETHWRDNEFGGQEGTYEPATYQDRALWADELEAIIGPAAFALGWLPGPIP